MGECWCAALASGSGSSWEPGSPPSPHQGGSSHSLPSPNIPTPYPRTRLHTRLPTHQGGSSHSLPTSPLHTQPHIARLNVGSENFGVFSTGLSLATHIPQPANIPTTYTQLPSPTLPGLQGQRMWGSFETALKRLKYLVHIPTTV